MGETSGVFRLISFLHWIERLVYVQFLWILFTVLGLGVFGLFPATSAMFTIMRKWLTTDEEIPVFSFMWKTYRSEFLKSNLYFYSLLLIGGSLYFYFKLCQNQTGLFFAILSIVLAIAGVFYCLSVMIAMPIYTHYELSLLSFYKIILYTIYSYPLYMITIIVIYGLFYLLMSKIPGLVPFFSFSVLAIAVMFIMTHVLNKMDERQVVLTSRGIGV